MSAILVTLHIIVCIALIMVVLLQTGKGSDMGAAFGGGGTQTLFGSTGASTFLSKATTVAAIVFMLTCLSLAYISGHRSGSSIMPDETPVEEKVPAETEKPSADVSAEQKESPVTEAADAAKDNVAAEETTASPPEPSDEAPAATADESAVQPVPESTSDNLAPAPAETAAQPESAEPYAVEAGEENKTDQ